MLSLNYVKVFITTTQARSQLQLVSSWRKTFNTQGYNLKNMWMTEKGLKVVKARQILKMRDSTQKQRYVNKHAGNPKPT